MVPEPKKERMYNNTFQILRRRAKCCTEMLLLPYYKIVSNCNVGRVSILFLLSILS